MTAVPRISKIRIREMHPEDLEQVREIDQLSFTMPWPNRAYEFELYENPTSALWVAEDIAASDHVCIVGMLVAWYIIDEAHIATLAVHPNFRGNGIAKLLIHTALLEALHRSMQSATLEVRANNIAAQDLYKDFGFKIVGHRPRYYRDNNEDAIIMTLKPLILQITTSQHIRTPENQSAAIVHPDA